MGLNKNKKVPIIYSVIQIHMPELAMFKRAPTYKRKDCSFCKTVRVVVALAVLVMLLASLSFDYGLLKGIQFTDLFATIVGVAFLIVIGYKVWDEYYRKR